MILKLNLKCDKGHEIVVYEIHFDLIGHFVFSVYCDECKVNSDFNFDYFTTVLQRSELKEC